MMMSMGATVMPGRLAPANLSARKATAPSGVSAKTAVPSAFRRGMVVSADAADGALASGLSPARCCIF